MNLQPRPYRGLDDLQQMKALIVEGRKVFPHSRYRISAIWIGGCITTRLSCMSRLKTS